MGVADRITQTVDEIKIKEALDYHDVELELSRLGLTALPSSLTQLQQVKKLDISGNRITALSNLIDQLPQLEELIAASNKLTELSKYCANASTSDV
jgi:Leucine-rich repeat (LRR) protein